MTVSYRKQIARQHSCHKMFRQGRGRGRPCKIFLSFSLTTMQDLVTECRSVRARVGGPPIFGTLRPAPWMEAWLTP